MDIPVAWISAKQAIEWGAPMSDIECPLRSLTLWELATIYTDGKNLLHFAIAKNRKDVLEYLFEKHTCLPQSATVPYMHVACAYGFKRIVELLVEERPEEEFSIIAVDDPHWTQFIATHPYHYDENDELCTRMTSLLEKKKMISAYEVAALYQQADCLQALLDKFEEDEWLSVMVARDQALALEMVLATMDFDEDALNKGFKKALDTVSPVCLEIMLRFAAKQGVTFSLINPYDFLYRRGDWCKGGSATKCTKLLICYGFNVNAVTGRSTFPLYTFLRLFVDPYLAAMLLNYAEPEKFLSEASTCLAELLAGGADPNFNEKTNVTSCEPSETDREVSFVPAYSSAVDLLSTEIFDAVGAEYLDFELVIRCIPLLVKYGCDLSWSDGDGDSLLHHLMNSSADTVYTHHIHMIKDKKKEDFSMFLRAVGVVLSQGGDFQVVNHGNAMPFTKFLDRFMKIVSGMGENHVGDQVFYENLLERVKHVYSFLLVMEVDSVCSVVKSGIEAIDRENSSATPTVFKDNLKKELLSYVRSVRTLYHMCLIRVWRCSGRKLANLECLEIPSHVVQDLEKMLHLT